MWSCDCGGIKKDVKELNDVMKILFCPVCNTGLIQRDMKVSEQVKLDHYLEIKDKKSTEIRREQIYNYLLKVSDATDSEIQKALGYKERNNISPRRFDLVEMKLVEENGKRLCTVTNNTVTAWRSV